MNPKWMKKFFTNSIEFTGTKLLFEPYRLEPLDNLCAFSVICGSIRACTRGGSSRVLPSLLSGLCSIATLNVLGC